VDPKLSDRRRRLQILERSLLDVIKSFMNVNNKTSIEYERDIKFRDSIRTSCNAEVLGKHELIIT
jgi:hypothetical protein